MPSAISLQTLQLKANNITGSTTGVAPASGYLGEKITWASAPTTYAVTTSEGDWSNAVIDLTKGNWEIKANIQVQLGTAASAGAFQDLNVKITDSSNNVLNSQSKLIRTKTAAAVAGDMVVVCSFATTVNLGSNTSYKIRAIRTDGGGVGYANLFNQAGLASEFYATRIG